MYKELYGSTEDTDGEVQEQVRVKKEPTLASSSSTKEAQMVPATGQAAQSRRVGSARPAEFGKPPQRDSCRLAKAAPKRNRAVDDEAVAVQKRDMPPVDACEDEHGGDVDDDEDDLFSQFKIKRRKHGRDCKKKPVAESMAKHVAIKKYFARLGLVWQSFQRVHARLSGSGPRAMGFLQLENHGS